MTKFCHKLYNIVQILLKTGMSAISEAGSFFVDWQTPGQNIHPKSSVKTDIFLK
jgi:hypothetical protein